jgi:glycosyltransferase involved in cell wall biosynthesis
MARYVPNNVKKVAQFIDSPDPGGAETLVVELAGRISKFNLGSELLHFGNSWIESKCQLLGLTCVRVPCYRYYRSARTLPLFTFAFARFLRDRNIAVVHSHLLGSVAAASLATALGRIGHVGTLHDTYSIEERPSRFAMLQVASALGTRLVVVSEQMKQYFSNLSTFYSPRLKTIHNGVSLCQFNRPRNEDLRRQLGFKSDDTVFIAVTRLVAIKRLDVLIKAFALLKKCPRAKLLIVGDGPHRKTLENLIVENGVLERVKLLEFRSDIPELLAASDCFVLSSDSEGLSYSIVESMAAGLPAVVTNVGGNKELVTHGESGYLVARDDPEQFAVYLEKMTSDARARRELGEKARVRAKRSFSIERTVEEYVELYRRLGRLE